MITTTINKNELKLYDSIDNMPIVNFQMFNRFLLIDSGIGSEFADIDVHITKIAKFINTDKKLALQELQNMRQLMYMISQGINPKHMSFACFIHSINGESFTDLTDSGINTVISKINKAPKSVFSALLEDLKKKLIRN